MKNSNLQLINQHFSNFSDLNDLALAASKAMAFKFPTLPFVMVRFRLSSKPLSILAANNIRLTHRVSSHSLGTIYQNLDQGFTQVFIPQQLDSAFSFILILPEQELRKDEVKKFIDDWQTLHQIIANYIKQVMAEQNLEYGNQISQLIHDVDSLMRLWKDPEQTPEQIEKRLAYQQKLNQRLLFFVRDLEVLKTKVGVKELIAAALESGEFKPLTRHVTYEMIDSKNTIEVDVELFNMALNEILTNALKASAGDYEAISLKISKVTVDLHFFLKHWLIVTIMNRGTGINPDFLPWIKTPYFTTWKEEGYTGFGLAICQKILDVHQGFLDIKSATDGSTAISLYWPLESNEKIDTKSKDSHR